MYLPLNGATDNVVHHDLDLHFQGQTFACYAFVIKSIALAADIPAPDMELNLFSATTVADNPSQVNPNQI